MSKPDPSNYNLDTDEGMANAVLWTNNTLALLRDGGIWYVPRSGTVVTVVGHADKTARVRSFVPDPSIERVLRAGGWSIHEQP